MGVGRFVFFGFFWFPAMFPGPPFRCGLGFGFGFGSFPCGLCGQRMSEEDQIDFMCEEDRTTLFNSADKLGLEIWATLKN